MRAMGLWFPGFPNARNLYPTDEDLSVGTPEPGALAFVAHGACVTRRMHGASGRLDCLLRTGGASERLIPMVLHFLIQGRVQGVGFRWFVQRVAGQLDLHGWVRNTEEGEVEVVASGTADELAELRSSLRRGPRGARVDRLIEHHLEESEAEELSSFRIDGAW